MRVIGNVIWLLFGGLWLALGYALAGLICFILVVTAPFGIAAFRIASFTLWPFGRVLVRRSGAGSASTAGNVIWMVFAGWWLALGHIVTGIAQCVTVIGIPLGLANFKLIPVTMTPLGRVIVPAGDSREFGLG